MNISGGIIVIATREVNIKTDPHLKEHLEPEMQHLHDNGSWQWLKREIIPNYVSTLNGFLAVFRVLWISNKVQSIYKSFSLFPIKSPKEDLHGDDGYENNIIPSLILFVHNSSIVLTQKRRVNSLKRLSLISEYHL